MKIIITVALFLCLISSAFAAVDDGMPFGDITDANVDALGAFAKTKGIDILSEMEKVYKKKDTAALARVFQFSAKLSSLDINSRAYGQIIYSSFLNLGESWGVKAYAQVVNSQRPEVQQRIRDFIFYPVSLLPVKERDRQERETKKAYPLMFPADYSFGQGNPIFQKTPNRVRGGFSPPLPTPPGMRVRTGRFAEVTGP
jgi:hypothetical protein